MDELRKKLTQAKRDVYELVCQLDELLDDELVPFGYEPLATKLAQAAQLLREARAIIEP